MRWEEMGYIFYTRTQFPTKNLMKLRTNGGFSSKLRIESLIELGHEASTYHPSPYWSEINLKTTYSNTRGDKSYQASILENVYG